MKKDLIITLFGSTGDLAVKKILPAISELLEQKMINNLAVIAVGRKDFDTMAYLDFAKKINPNINIELFKESLAYVNMDIMGLHDFFMLKGMLKDLSDSNTKFIHYFALAPDLIVDVSRNLSDSGLMTKESYNHVAIVEKPFGTNLKTAVKIKKQLWKYFTENQIYRIDHYLGKDIVKQIYSTKFSSTELQDKFEQGISEIKVHVFESDGILNRGEYYDKAGAMKDMFQNHVLQMVSLLLINKANCFVCDEMIDNKVKAVKSLGFNKKTVLFGQYGGYTKENKVSKNSRTETMVSVVLNSSLKNYKDVPIYILTGKKMQKKETVVEVFFKDGDSLQFNVDGQNNVVLKHKNQKKVIYVSKNALQPYASLILDAFRGEKKFFVRYDEIEAAWKLVDKMLKVKKHVFAYEDNKRIAEKIKDLQINAFEDVL